MYVSITLAFVSVLSFISGVHIHIVANIGSTCSLLSLSYFLGYSCSLFRLRPPIVVIVSIAYVSCRTSECPVVYVSFLYREYVYILSYVSPYPGATPFAPPPGQPPCPVVCIFLVFLLYYSLHSHAVGIILYLSWLSSSR